MHIEEINHNTEDAKNNLMQNHLDTLRKDSGTKIFSIENLRQDYIDNEVANFLNSNSERLTLILDPMEILETNTYSNLLKFVNNSLESIIPEAELEITAKHEISHLEMLRDGTDGYMVGVFAVSIFKREDYLVLRGHIKTAMDSSLPISQQYYYLLKALMAPALSSKVDKYLSVDDIQAIGNILEDMVRRIKADSKVDFERAINLINDYWFKECAVFSNNPKVYELVVYLLEIHNY